MKVDDRSFLAEQLIFQLWQKNYFSTIPLKTIDGSDVTILSTGILNQDSGPDFKNISIKVGEQILQGDLEIHRAPEDWYGHQHHADPHFNNVIMHLVIGAPTHHEPPIRLNRQEVAVQIFTDISPEQFEYLAKKYKISPAVSPPSFFCKLEQTELEFKLQIIEKLGRERLQTKALRFTELRAVHSWNQILYTGFMEALGYSKNQIPFRKLAQLLPFEALMREFQMDPDAEPLYAPLALLIGAAGLLPSQDPSCDWRKVKDNETQEYVPRLEKIWQAYSARLGLKPMDKNEWQFFRMRPNNFPTRRLAGASAILRQFYQWGILEKLIPIVEGIKDNPTALVKELEQCFICKTSGYWASHYRLDETFEEAAAELSGTLVGKDRAREIVVNTVLPVLHAFAGETENSGLKIHILQVYSRYPKIASNSIIQTMRQTLFGDGATSQRIINTALKQQGLIHLYKLYCHRKECARCRATWENPLHTK
ncbi:MAG: DUF2851 family protein [Candidatus Zhuqueibacterota bacterium]